MPLAKVIIDPLLSGPKELKKVDSLVFAGLADTWIRREFHCFPSKVAENRAFVSEMLQQSLDFHKHNFNPPGVLIYESDGVSHPPTFE